jgi:hypothetical protein
MDFRQHRRYEVSVPVDYSGDEISGNGTVTKLSPGGCAILGDGAMRVGSCRFRWRWYAIASAQSLGWIFYHPRESFRKTVRSGDRNCETEVFADPSSTIYGDNSVDNPPGSARFTA